MTIRIKTNACFGPIGFFPGRARRRPQTGSGEHQPVVVDVGPRDLGVGGEAWAHSLPRQVNVSFLTTIDIMKFFLPTIIFFLTTIIFFPGKTIVIFPDKPCICFWQQTDANFKRKFGRQCENHDHRDRHTFRQWVWRDVFDVEVRQHGEEHRKQTGSQPTHDQTGLAERLLRGNGSVAARSGE